MTSTSVHLSHPDKAVGSVPKRSPIAGWFGRKSDDGDVTTSMDVSGGVSRALRLASKTDDLKDKNATREPIRDALVAIEGALFAIDQIRDVIDQAYDVALSAQETDDPAARALLAESYDELRLTITEVVENAADEDCPLVGKHRRQIDVQLGGRAHYSITPIRLDSTNKGLDLSPPREAFSDDGEIRSILEELDRAMVKADRAAAGYCRDAQFLIARLEIDERKSA